MKLILLCVWAEPAVLGSAKTALKFIYKIQIGYYLYTIQCMGQFMSFKSKIKKPWFNPWFIWLHTHSNVCAPVEGQWLEYLVCITLITLRNCYRQNARGASKWSTMWPTFVIQSSHKKILLRISKEKAMVFFGRFITLLSDKLDFL